MIPELAASDNAVLIPIYCYRAGSTKMQIVFGSERDLKRFNIDVLDAANGMPCDLTAAMIDKLISKFFA